MKFISCLDLSLALGDGAEVNRTRAPSRKRVEVFDDSLSSIVVVLDTSFSETVSPSDALGTVDQDYVGSIKHKVEYTPARVGHFDGVFKRVGVGPLAVDSDGMVAGDSKSSG